MKRLKILASLLLLVSFGCNMSAPPPSPTLPPTAIPTITPSPVPTPTSSPTPIPTVSVSVSNARYDFEQLQLSGELSGIPRDAVLQSNLTLLVFNSYNVQLMEQVFPCAEPSQSPNAICAFNITIADPLPDIFRYRVVAEVSSSFGQLKAEKEGIFDRPLEASSNTSSPGRFSIGIKMPDPARGVKGNLAIDVNVNDSSAGTESSSLKYEMCIYVAEYRQYESDETKGVWLTRECKDLRFRALGENSATASTSFLFNPSGYGFVWNDSEEGRYKISEIKATAVLNLNDVAVTSSSASYLPVPLRVLDVSRPDSGPAQARLEILAGEGEVYDVTLRVYQVEADPDEVGWSSILIFIPCLLPGICDDRTEIGRATQPITLRKGEFFTITADYAPAPVSEEGNFVTGYAIELFFEDILLISK